MQHLLTALEFARANSHKCNAVAVRLVHIGLNFKDKSREMVLKRINYTDVGRAGGRRRGHLQELLEKRFYAEVGQC